MRQIYLQETRSLMKFTSKFVNKCSTMTTTQFTFIVVAVFFVFNSLKVEAYLYSTNDIGITILDVDNFTDYVRNKENVFMIEFYSSWCGHCIRFAPKFKKFAADIVNWKSVVEVAVIDCAENRNVPICSHYGIHSYPTIKYFWRKFNPETKKSSDNIDIADGVPENPKILRQQLLDYLSSRLSRSPVQSWPNLMPARIDDLFAAKVTNNTILAYVENASSYVGQEVILDLVNYRKYVNIFRLLFSDSLMRKILPPSEYQYSTPLLLQVNHRNKSVKVLLTALNMPLDRRSFIVKYIKNNYLTPMLYTTRLPDVEIERNKSEKTPPIDEKSNIYIADLYKGLRYTLFNQIPLHRELNANEINILKRFIGIIEKYFPFDDEVPRKFISSVKEWLETIGERLETGLLVEMLQVFDAKYPFPEPADWIGCKGSERQYRGYPCSLWLLYHTLTAIEYEKSSVTPRSINHEVLYTMRDHIKTFFSCKDCADHFMSTAKDLEHSLVYKNSSVLWLWKKHNEVNKRLKGDLTEDPQHPKYQFPPKEICSSCHHPTGEFDESKVLDFLLNQYGAQHIVKRYLFNDGHFNNDKGISSNHDSKNSASPVIVWQTISLSKVENSMLIYLMVFGILLVFLYILLIERSREKGSAKVKMAT